MTDGARIRLATHIDYIRRDPGVANPAGELLLYVLDEQEMRAAKNHLACYTNISGGWYRARSLFEAAERAAPPPKSHLLQASTAQVTSFEYQLKFGGAPAWFREMTRRLQAEAAKVEHEAIERGQSPPIAQSLLPKSQARSLRTSRLVESITQRELVGETGFEPATSCSQSRRATRLRHSPTRDRP